MSHPASAKTVAELRSLSDGDLVKQHDILAGDTGVGVDYYLAELGRRRIDRQNKRMELLTLIIGVLTLVNVVAVIISLAQ
jgi:hypothetical protein